jgi:hypothetical protein
MYLDFIDEINQKFPNNIIHLSLKAKLYGKVFTPYFANITKIGLVRKSKEIHRKIEDLSKEREEDNAKILEMNKAMQYLY